MFHGTVGIVPDATVATCDTRATQRTMMSRCRLNLVDQAVGSLRELLLYGTAAYGTVDEWWGRHPGIHELTGLYDLQSPRASFDIGIEGERCLWRVFLDAADFCRQNVGLGQTSCLVSARGGQQLWMRPLA